jgi:hypothetical protein
VGGATADAPAARTAAGAPSTNQRPDDAGRSARPRRGAARASPRRRVQGTYARGPHRRGAEGVEVVAVGEHATAQEEDAVHGSREARSDGLHPRREVLTARGLHDHVHVIRLDRVVRHPEAPALARGAQAFLELPDESHVTQRRKPGLRLQRHVREPRRRRPRWCGSLGFRLGLRPRLHDARPTADQRPRELSQPVCHRPEPDTGVQIRPQPS